MRERNKIRAWINKNDGKHFQVDNQNFNVYEVAGYISLILAFVVYLFHDKVDFQSAWLGWLFLCFGCSTLFIGVLKKVKNGENT